MALHTLAHYTLVMHRHHRRESREPLLSGGAPGVAKVQLRDLCSSLHSHVVHGYHCTMSHQGRVRRRTYCVEHAKGGMAREIPMWCTLHNLLLLSPPLSLPL
jgi:hypothetical protein